MEFIINHITLLGLGRPKPQTTVILADSIKEAIDGLYELKPSTIQIASINGENYSELI